MGEAQISGHHSMVRSAAGARKRGDLRRGGGRAAAAPGGRLTRRQGTGVARALTGTGGAGSVV
ncbi:hypothetical protein KCH_28780 [Kitasatospora cheerisanensis KCTC 2395]|uniref:Uncharacterized protein n=1 Tax=Kitasatospora cheerisanensis KCTC 2395 TaxID=1348663 RepID=A0A066YVQ2_9ACTN|nr:hypothetical protein KCH_28780 [Kitasatospora cheerisanensis KCTC 2395]